MCLRSAQQEVNSATGGFGWAHRRYKKRDGRFGDEAGRYLEGVSLRSLSVLWERVA